jgi:hypothetical protein
MSDQNEDGGVRYLPGDRIKAAQLLIKIAGGEDEVAPWVIEVAHATPLPARPMTDEDFKDFTQDEIELAQYVIKFAGGEDKVDPLIVKLAHATPSPHPRPQPWRRRAVS